MEWVCRSTINSCFRPDSAIRGNNRSSGERSVTRELFAICRTLAANLSTAPSDRWASFRARRRHSRNPTPPPSSAVSTRRAISLGESAKAPHPIRVTNRHMSFRSSDFFPPSTSTTGCPTARISRTLIVPGLVTTRSCSRIRPAKSFTQPRTTRRSLASGSDSRRFFFSSSSRPTTAVTSTLGIDNNRSAVRTAFRRREFTR